ncbi:hypothetical protein LINGRAPRIM_LOCUS1548 [Linum grandiflorum]
MHQSTIFTGFDGLKVFFKVNRFFYIISNSEKLSGRTERTEVSEGQKDRRQKADTITSSGKADHSNGGSRLDSDSDGSGKQIIEGKEKGKHKRSSHRNETSSDDDYSHDSDVEERKESKKRRKEEKKLRKEDKRRRREERRRKREERRAQKLKRKDRDETSSSSDDDEHVEKKRKSRLSDDEKDHHSEQKKLEIELRKKALESLKAKKGIDH